MHVKMEVWFLCNNIIVLGATSCATGITARTEELMADPLFPSDEMKGRADGL